MQPAADPEAGSGRAVARRSRCSPPRWSGRHRDEGNSAMKNLVLAIATGLALTLAVAPTFAASGKSGGSQNQTAAERSGGSYGESCGAILANQSGHSRGEVQACE